MNPLHSNVISLHIADAIFATVGLAAFFQFLPPLAAALTIMWTVIRIWETKTVQRWVRYFCPTCGSYLIPPKE